MFWKKKNKDKDKSKGFSAPDFGPREAYRVKPSLEEPLFMEIDGKTLTVFDVSSGGISFADAGLVLHKTYKATFDLPDEFLEIQADLLILRIEKNGICYAQFMELPTQSEDRIHAYVLDRQKEILQSRKRP